MSILYKELLDKKFAAGYLQSIYEECQSDGKSDPLLIGANDVLESHQERIAELEQERDIYREFVKECSEVYEYYDSLGEIKSAADSILGLLDAEKLCSRDVKSLTKKGD